MSDVTIFQNKSVATDGSNELSDLAKIGRAHV